MTLLRNIGTVLVAACIATLATGFAKAQDNQQNQQQQQNGSTGSTTAPQQNNVPYNPPAPPTGGAETGSYSGKGTVGFGSGGGTGTGTDSGNGTGIGGLKRNPTGFTPPEEPPQNQQQLELLQARARNAERQKQLVADTQKLVALANELQAEVNQSTKDMLSLDVVRKADEIDKLARTVRDKMKNAN